MSSPDTATFMPMVIRKNGTLTPPARISAMQLAILRNGMKAKPMLLVSKIAGRMAVSIRIIIIGPM